MKEVYQQLWLVFQKADQTGRERIAQKFNFPSAAHFRTFLEKETGNKAQPKAVRKTKAKVDRTGKQRSLRDLLAEQAASKQVLIDRLQRVI